MRYSTEPFVWLPHLNLIYLFKSDQVSLSLNKNKMKADSLHCFQVLFLRLKTGEKSMCNSPMLWSGCVDMLTLGCQRALRTPGLHEFPSEWTDLSWVVKAGAYNYRVAAVPLLKQGLLLHQTFPYQFFNYLWLMSTLGTVSDTHIILFPDVSSRN